MSDPEQIKNQSKVNSEAVTPEEAAKDIAEIEDEQLKDIAGGVTGTKGPVKFPYADVW
jgi:hypothetical protein